MEYIVVSVLNGVVHGLLLFMVSAGLTRADVVNTLPLGKIEAVLQAKRNAKK